MTHDLTRFFLLLFAMTLLAGCGNGGSPPAGERQPAPAVAPPPPRDPGELLRLAAREGRLDDVRRLLESGVDPENADPREGTTPLASAVMGGHPDVIDALLEAGADIDAAPRPGRRAIEIAAFHSRKEKLALHVLAAGADVSFEGGGRLLEQAARGQKIQLIQALLEAGVQPLSFSNRELLVSLAHPEGDYLQRHLLLRTLAEGGAKSETICLAIKERDLELARGLIEGGADPNGRCQVNQTALVMASRLADFDTVKRLVEAGADANQRASGGDTPLTIAAGKGDYDMVRLLVEHGAEVQLAELSPSGKVNSTPLIQAAGSGAVETLRYLLTKGAGASADIEELPTALREAAVHGHEGAVDALLTAGAKLADNASLAGLECRADAARLLVKAGVDPGQPGPNGELPLAEATRCREVGLIDVLLAGGVRIDGRDSNGRTALHAAVTFRGPAAEHLLSRGAAVDARDNEDKTPLRLAVEAGKKQTPRLEKLVLAGADIDARDHDGRTALMHVADSLDSEMIAALFDLGADEHVRDNEGKMASDLYTERLFYGNPKTEIRAAGLYFYFLLPECFRQERRNEETLRIYHCSRTRGTADRFDTLTVSRSAIAGSTGTLMDLPLQPRDSSGSARVGTVVEIAGDDVLFELKGPRQITREMNWALAAITESVQFE